MTRPARVLLVQPSGWAAALGLGLRGDALAASVARNEWAGVPVRRCVVNGRDVHPARDIDNEHAQVAVLGRVRFDAERSEVVASVRWLSTRWAVATRADVLRRLADGANVATSGCFGFFPGPESWPTDLRPTVFDLVERAALPGSRLEVAR